MSVVITPTDTLHATVAGPAPLDPADGTEISVVGQACMDNAQHALNRIGDYRVHQIAEDSISGGGTPAEATTFTNTVAGPWVAVVGDSVSLPDLIAGDIVHAKYMCMMSVFDSGGGGAGAVGSISFGGSVPGLGEPWTVQSSDLAADRVFPVTLTAHGLIVAPATYAVSLRMASIGGVTVKLWAPTSLQVVVYRSNV